MGDNENNLSHIGQPADQPCYLRHAIKIQAAGRFIEYQQVFPTNHTDGYRHPLFLAAGKCVWMAFSVWAKPQFLQSRIYQRLIWITDAKGTLCLYTVSKKLIIYILHNHIGAFQPCLALHRLAFPQKMPLAVFMKPAEGAGKCSLSGSVMADHANHFTLSCGQANIMQNGSLLVTERHIPQFQYRDRGKRVGLGRKHRPQIDCPQAHVFTILFR